MRLEVKNQTKKQVKTSPLDIPTITPIPTPTPKVIYVTITPTLTPLVTSAPILTKHSAEYCDAMAEKIRADNTIKMKQSADKEYYDCLEEVGYDPNFKGFCEERRQFMIDTLTPSLDKIVADSRLECLQN